MQVTQVKINDFMSQFKTQFVIPVYQRNYDWKHKHCEQLLNDILEVGRRSDLPAHFIGSIVYVHDDVYVSTKIKELSIIDGQQRLTTLTLIYMAMFHLYKDMDDQERADETNEVFLINKYLAEGQKLKLRPTENNAKVLAYLYRGDKEEESTTFSQLIENYKFFRERITPTNLELVKEGLTKLIFVEISLERGKDDPQRIFESLNSTGLDLAQSDLVRNYILMDLDRENQHRVYQDYWEVIERLARSEQDNQSKVSDFLRDYLTFKTKEIPNKKKVYEAFKQKFPTSHSEVLETNLLELKTWSKYYNKLLNPKNESDREIRLHLEYISRMEINVVYPFLMKIYDDYATQTIDRETFVSVLELVQSFAWRRFVVRLPTNALNKIFMTLYSDIKPEKYLESLQIALVRKTGTQRFPNNKEVRDELKSLDVYSFKSKNRFYLFDRLENHHNRERVMLENNTDITVEHIFPQNPDPRWKMELGDEYNALKEKQNTLANLTLSGNNSKLGNLPFLEKRDKAEAGYRDSRLWLNKFLSEIEVWNLKTYNERFKILAERFFEVWTYPKVKPQEEEQKPEVNIFEAEDPTNKKLEYAIFYDQRVEIRQVAKLYLHVFEYLFEHKPTVFFNTELGERVGLTNNPEKSKTRQAIRISEGYFIEAGYSNKDKFDRLKFAMKIFDAEDELLVKFSD